MFAPLTDTVSIENLYAMREQGMGNAQIAKALEVSVGTVTKYIGPQGGKRIPRRFTEEVIQQMREMKEAGMTNGDIAGKFETSAGYVGKLIGGNDKGGMISKAIPLPRKKSKDSEETPACLIIQNKTYELHGLYGAYVIDVKKKEITIETTDDSGELQVDSCSFEGLEEKINRNLDKIKKINDMNSELLAIKRKMNALVIGSEMW